MTLLDWLIVTVPVLFVMGMGFYSRKYVKSVADFLVAGRLCGRYVISVGDVANALAIIGLVAYVEAQYKTGFALSFWNGFAMPLSIVIALTGYCTYRFRRNPGDVAGPVPRNALQPPAAHLRRDAAVALGNAGQYDHARGGGAFFHLLLRPS